MEEPGDREAEEVGGNTEEDNPDGANGVRAHERGEEPGVRDKPDEEKSAEQEDSFGEEAQFNDELDEREQNRPGCHEGFSDRRIGSDILVNHLDDGLS